MQQTSRCKDNEFDAVVIGGGFYGCVIAIYLAKQRNLKKILLVEQETQLLSRASYNNQARVHNGYHYPRSFITAYRSRINLPRFVHDWPSSVKKDFTKIYAIARRNSKVTAKQFQRFCKEIGANLEPADQSLHQLFEPRLIENIFLAEEYAFDSTKLLKSAEAELIECGVGVSLDTKVTNIFKGENKRLQVELSASKKFLFRIKTDYIFNCTYSGLNQIDGDFPGVGIPIKHEITEMPLLQMPSPLKKIGITVMDGPFFSIMPFPARDLHTLSHVRYTPHLQWLDQRNFDPYKKLNDYDKSTRFERMIRDVRRYLPAIEDVKYIDSLFETKTVLIKNEGDDGRPILFEKHHVLPGCYSVLGGKIDNIYDVLEKIDAENI